VVCERSVAAGQADDGPCVARRKGAAAAAAGDRPAFDARAVDAQRGLVIATSRARQSDQVARAHQGVDARAMAPEQLGSFGDI